MSCRFDSPRHPSNAGCIFDGPGETLAAFVVVGGHGRERHRDDEEIAMAAIYAVAVHGGFRGLAGVTINADRSD